MSRKFNPEGVPAPGFYSHGVEIVSPQRLVFVAGQVGVRADGSVAEGIGEQARVAVANLNAVLAAAGMDGSNIVKSTIYLTDESLMDGFAAAAGPLLPSPPPATTLVYVKALASPALLVEIEAVAAA
ncbi:MAG TPA: RidA family protein [Aquamicrobium sp.]|jgi:enamine deaminase RidA (YjgF/YER057c/UK114 family)|nr:RidA family protein [Aquamicrobium sp.]